MAKKKNKKQKGQQFLSPEQYIRQKARTLEIGKCYVDNDLEKAGEGHIIVSRKHTGGRVSVGFYLVDIWCVGVKRSFYRLRMEDYELDEMIDSYQLNLRECSYDEVHNWIYGAIAFAEEAGIAPDKSFNLTQYFLVEDDDDIPLMEFDFGRKGKHTLVASSNLEASRYLPLLEKNLGKGNYEYILRVDEYEDDFEEDEDEDDWDEDEDEESEGPIYMRQLVDDIEINDLLGCAAILGLKIDTKASEEEIRRQYIEGVLSDPYDILCRLPNEDTAMLETAQNEHDNRVFYPDNYRMPLLYHYGFADEDWDEDGNRVIQIAKDFADAMSPHLATASEEPANMGRLIMEAVIDGLANLFGEIRLDEAKRYIKMVFDHKEDLNVDRLSQLVMGHSLLLDWMAVPLGPAHQSVYELPDDQVVFLSLYGWNTPEKLRDKIAQRQTIPSRRDYTMEEIIQSSSVQPTIPNPEAKHFHRFLQTTLGYDEEEAKEISFNLWYRAQHEEDESFEDGTYQDYFTKEVLRQAPKRIGMKQMNEAISALTNYMNAMPRWILKGHSPNEVNEL